MEDLIVCSYGGGTNSVALLIELVKRKIKVDLILFADPGGEMPHTYNYLKIFSEWLIKNNMPPITIVRTNKTLEEDCLERKALPSIAYGGFKSCSQRFKIRPQDKFMNNYEPAKEVWKSGNKILKIIGYDAGEPHRVKDYSDKKYNFWYPLVEWDIWRSDCEKIILNAGLPLPGKSSCFFCPSMKKYEILKLKKDEPELLNRALNLEANADLTTIKGLARDYSWKSLIEANESQLSMFCDVISDVPCSCYDG